MSDPRLEEALAAPEGHRTNEGLVFDSIDQGIAYFNKHFAQVRKYGIMEVVYNSDYNRLEYDFLSKGDAADMLASLRVEIMVKGQFKLVPMFPIWFASTDRRQFTGGLEFHPSASLVDMSEQQQQLLKEGKALPEVYVSPPGKLNLWRGYGVEPKSGGSWSKLATHLFENICNSNPNLFTYIIRWAAYMVQFPDRQGEVALVFRGGKGCGKGVFFRALVKLLGQHGMQIFNPEHLVNKFNAHLGDCVALFADEAFYAGDVKHEGGFERSRDRAEPSHRGEVQRPQHEAQSASYNAGQQQRLGRAFIQGRAAILRYRRLAHQDRRLWIFPRNRGRTRSRWRCWLFGDALRLAAGSVARSQPGRGRGPAHWARGKQMAIR